MSIGILMSFFLFSLAYCNFCGFVGYFYSHRFASVTEVDTSIIGTDCSVTIIIHAVDSVPVLAAIFNDRPLLFGSLSAQWR
ncbi:MAG: hypothetical protein QGG02_05235 [Gammaproteobacteria bacterium]|nr:hypothetical protein [Gammaproteobacteria bacterium]MDP6733206.1 hypothetical protein [Gammaproteobacteria bacterium]